MPNLLEFVHATARSAQTPQSVRRRLGEAWKVKRSGLGSVSSWKTLPAFTWVDLGTIHDPVGYTSCWKKLADLQVKSPPLSHIFISGSASSLAQREQILRDVYGQLKPVNVEVDLAGQPDVVAALAKFDAVRREPAITTFLEAFWKNNRGAPSAPYIPNADLRGASGNLSAKSIAELFGVTLTEVGEWIDRKKAALSKTPDSENIQPLLEPLAQIAFYRKVLGNDETFRKWLRTEHELLEHKCPLHWIKAGRIREVAEFVDDALTGQPT